MYWGMTEQPSPMPELVSEGPSSRSHSIAYERLSELLGARAQPEHQYRHIADAEEEVDELVDDPLEPESLPPPTPRFIVARKSTNYQSKSPLFASSSSTDDEKPVKSKEPNRNVRYPVKAQVKAAGLVRQRIRQPSKPHVVSSEEEELVQHRIESKHIASVGDVNKENTRSQEGIVESTAFEAPVDDPQSHGVKPPRRSNIYMVHQAIEGDERDPEEKRLPAKELDLIGKTPPSPKEPVRTIKLDVITPDFDEIVRKTLDNVTLGEEKMPNIGSKVRYALSRSVPAFNKNRITKFAAKNGPRMSLSHPLRGSDSEDGLEEPSPLKGKDEKVQYDDDEENAGEGAKTRVRFDGVPANRQRRKTTGGVGFTFGMGTVHGKSQVVASETIPGPSNLSRGDYLSFPKPKDVMDARKHGDGVVDLSDDDEKQSEDSPLARYSHAATSSPQKSVAKSVQMRYGRSSLGGRSSQGYIPPPPAKKIPVVDSSSPPTRRSSVQPSPTPHLQERNKAIVRNPQMRNVAIQEFAEAKWSPFRFSQTQSQSQRTLDSQAYFASQSQVGSQMAERYLIDAEDQEGSVVTNTGLSMDYRDQHADAEWVQTVHGRPVLTAREINRDGRSAPIPSKDDVVVYSSSRAPSRRGSPSRARPSDPASRSRRRSRRKSELELDERTFRLMSDADKRIVWKYLVDHQVIEPDDEIEPAVMVDGLAYQLEHLARVYGLGSRVPRTVWYECGDLVMTKEVLDEMSGGAEQKGEQKLASYETALGNDELLRRQDQVRRRAKSGRSSFGEGRQGRARQFVDRLMAATARGASDGEDDDSLSESDEDESEGDNEVGAGFVRGRPEPRRSAGVSRRGETPEYVPLAVVVQP
ncbi:hypothetical protein FRC18_005731 [Serendipita sp. 400]|nr:hypothetical protein FRC18_005731 [Serendipita sp. 400]